jgi:hypothetical protein
MGAIFGSGLNPSSYQQVERRFDLLMGAANY